MDKIIVDKKDETNSKVIIAYWTQETLDEIKQKSGELADICEYQVHYWALNLTHTTKDNEEIIVHIPLVIFNYPQEVTTGTTSFSLNEVDLVSEATRELAEAKAEEAYQDFLENFPLASRMRFEPSCVSLNTLHRHP